MKHRLRRLLALALSLAILLSMGSAGAWAAETEDELTEAEDWLTSEEAFNESDDSSLAVDELPTEDSFMEEEVVEESVTEEAMMAPADEHKHDGITFEEWTETDRLPDTPGSYCLTGDVTISGTWNVPGGTTNLCLNGHGIRKTGNSSSVISVTSGRTLNLYDCGSTVQHSFTVPNPAPNGAGMAVVDAERTEGHEIFSGGYITGGCEVSEGGGLNIRGGVVNMYGGNIIGNSTNDGSGTTNGGAVFMDNSAMFTMYGGAIQYNFGRNGASLFVENGSTFVLEGGSVSYGKGGRGGIFSRGTVKIHGGEVLNHYCTIWESGGFNGWDGTLEITGGTISGNTGVNARLAGIMPASLTLGGNPLISDNLDKNGNQANLYLNDGRVITIASKLSSSVKSNRIGVSMNSGTGVFTSGWSSIMGEADPAEYFFSENSDAIIILLNGEATLVPENYRLIHLLPGENSGEEIAVASESGTEYTLPASPFTSPEGKAFAGWSDGENVYQVGDSYSITQEVTFTAQWAPGTTLTYELADSYGDGWNGAAIQVTDKASGAELVSLSIGNGGSASGSFDVLAGRTIVFSWKPGSYDNECSYTVWDAEGNVVFSGSSSMTPPIEYTYYAPVATVTSGGTSTDYADFAAAVSAWNSAESGAELKLLANVTTASTVAVSGTKTLDLNGHGLLRTGSENAASVISGVNAPTLTIMDSQPNTEHYLTLNNYRATSVSSSGTENISDGNGVVKVTGGYIAGGYYAQTTGDYHGTALDFTTNGGKLSVKGCTIIGNRNNSVTHGGTVSIYHADTTAALTGTKVLYNYSGFTGGVWASGDATVTIDGGAVLSHNVGRCGAAFYFWNGNGVKTLGDCRITDNICNNNTRAVQSESWLTFKGKPVIKNNKNGNNANANVLLCKAGQFTIDGELSEGAEIGLYCTVNILPCVFTSNVCSESNLAKFSSDRDEMLVGLNADGKGVLGTPVEVTYKVVNGTWSDDSTADKTETVASGAKPASVPTGMKASEGYTGGAWDTDPVEATITGATTFTYTFEAKTPASVTKAPEAKSLTYDGSAQELVSAGTAEGGSMRYALGTNATTAPTEGWATSIPTGTNAGTCYVWYKAIGDASHIDSDPASVSVSIGQKEVGLSWSDTSFTYDGQSHQPSAAASGLVAGDTCTVTVTGEQTDAGTYTATASALSNGSYKLPDSPTTSFTIEKAEPGTPQVTMQGYTYGGTLPTPSIGDYDGGGAVTWYYSTSDSNSGGTAWTDSMTATSLYAGTYYMYAVIAPTENYLGYTTQTSRFEITPGVVTVSGSINFGNYSGNLTLSLLTSDGKETAASDSINVSGGKGTYHFEHITQGQYILRASWSEGGAENVLNDELEIR